MASFQSCISRVPVFYSVLVLLMKGESTGNYAEDVPTKVE